MKRGLRSALLLLPSALAGRLTVAFPLPARLPPRRREHARESSCLYSAKDEKRAIGDVVQGLHGSKYQFNDAGINFEGQQFAETGYSSGQEVQDDTYENEPIPKWALKMKELSLPPNAPPLVMKEGMATIEVQNAERSWEMFYAFVVGPLAESITARPWVGQLAPRGGINQFSDTVVIQIGGSQTSAGGSSENDSWLVVGTEADKWFYKLIRS